MKNKISFILITLFLTVNISAKAGVKTYADLSYRLIIAIQEKKDVSKMLDSLQNVAPDVLIKELDSDGAKMAFWINVYNGYIQIILGDNPEKYATRSKFFSDKHFYIAGQHLSFEDVEHGIIRHSKPPNGAGFFNAWFPGKFERQMRTSKADARIHFAINCGAQSCPPVGAYDYRRVDEQLDIISKYYLSKHSNYIASENTIYLPSLMKWFSADFGWFKNKRRLFLIEHGAIPEGENPKFRYNEYKWKLELNSALDEGIDF